MTWTVRWTPSAKKDLRRLDSMSQMRIHDAARRFGDTGYGDLEKLAGRDRRWRSRIGDHRVVLHLDPAARSAVVLRVRHRSDVYRD